MQDRQPSVPPKFDASLEGRKLEIRWRYILTPTPGAISLTPTHTYMWCEGEVVSVADGKSDKRSERAHTLLPAGAL
eukprot:2305741-Pleurochrysis_carterae.AAC.1